MLQTVGKHSYCVPQLHKRGAGIPSVSSGQTRSQDQPRPPPWQVRCCPADDVLVRLWCPRRSKDGICFGKPRIYKTNIINVYLMTLKLIFASIFLYLKTINTVTNENLPEYRNRNTNLDSCIQTSCHSSVEMTWNAWTKRAADLFTKM